MCSFSQCSETFLKGHFVTLSNVLGTTKSGTEAGLRPGKEPRDRPGTEAAALEVNAMAAKIAIGHLRRPRKAILLNST
jgi:hypothetical protein